MPSQAAMHQRVLQEFTLAFGPPHTIAGNGCHWSLRAATGTPPINVLLNGTSDHATVWVMDPHNAIDGVEGQVVTDSTTIPALVDMVRTRLERAWRRSP